MVTAAIELTIQPRTRTVGSGTVQRLLPHARRRMVGPFIFADVIGPDDIPAGAGLDVDAHPHIGLATVTYVLEGRLRHRDSLGSVTTISPGAVNWMTAGRGICHTERSLPEDRTRETRIFGVQTWVALTEADEDSPPRFEHRGTDEIPQLDRDGATIRVVAGTAWGVASPVTTSSPMVLADVVVDGGRVPIDATHPELAVLCLDGEIGLADQPLGRNTLTVVDASRRPELSGRGRVLVLGGEPVGARHIWWNFVHSDRERIEDAKQRWARQEFAPVPDDHTPWVPLPS